MDSAQVDSAQVDSAQVDSASYVSVIAMRLNQRLTAISAEVRAELEMRIPELRADSRTVELLDASVEANIDTVLHALRHKIDVERITAPAAALEYARRLAQHGVPVNALVRAYRLGQRRLTEFVFAELRRLDMEPLARVTAIEAISKVMFDYIDRTSQEVVAVYEQERERWLENLNSLRALKVREVLADGAAVDVDAVSTEMRYPLRWHHLAVVMWYPQDEAGRDDLARLPRFLRELGAAVDAGAAPLFAAIDRTTGYGWLPYRGQPADAVSGVRRAVEKLPDAPNIALGMVGKGVEGFRRSHRQAQYARLVGSAREVPAPMVIAAGDAGVSAVALLGHNVPDARDWVGQVLGALATDSENDARLRDTLRVFLRAGSSYKTAAHELNLHFNSVKYRVAKAIERRGRPIDEDRLDVELALLICHWYGTAALQPA